SLRSARLFQKSRAAARLPAAGRPSKMWEKPRTKTPRAVPEPLGQYLHPAIFQGAVLQTALRNQAQSSRHSAGGSQPSRSSRGAFRPAAQAWAKAGFGCSRGAGEVADVALFCSARATDRPAVNAGAEHGDEELAVEARVARQPRSRADLPAQVHRRHSLRTRRKEDTMYCLFDSPDPFNFQLLLSRTFTCRS